MIQEFGKLWCLLVTKKLGSLRMEDALLFLELRYSTNQGVENR
jgi:hypothetical protein